MGTTKVSPLLPRGRARTHQVQGCLYRIPRCTSRPLPRMQLQFARCGVTLRTGRNYHHVLHEQVHLAFQLPRLRLGPRKPPLGEDNLKIRESCPWSISKLTCVLPPRLLEMRVHILIEFPLDTTISLQIPSTPESDRRVEPQQRVTGGGRSFFESSQSTDWQGQTASRHQCTPLLPTWQLKIWAGETCSTRLTSL